MGFFAQFKRNANGAEDETDTCARAVSLFPSKHAETQIVQDSDRTNRAVGAKSFSYGSLGKVCITVMLFCCAEVACIELS